MERTFIFIAGLRKFLRLFCIASITLFFPQPADVLCAEPETGWHIAKDKNGIRIYNRSVEGSSFNPYRGVMVVESNLSALTALVADAENYPNWVDTCRTGKTLRKIDDAKSIIYTVNEAPWPVSDRDSIVETVIVQNPETKVVHIHLEGLPDYLPRKEGFVRVEKVEGFWRFTPMENDQVEVVYQVHTEPGGKLPSWLINSLILNQPYRTLEKMREIVQKPEYKNAIIKPVENVTHPGR